MTQHQYPYGNTNSSFRPPIKCITVSNLQQGPQFWGRWMQMPKQRGRRKLRASLLKGGRVMVWCALIQCCCELTHFSPKVPSGLNILVVEIDGRNIKYYELITSSFSWRVVSSRFSCPANSQQDGRMKGEETQNGVGCLGRRVRHKSNCQQSTANIACFVKFWMLH